MKLNPFSQFAVTAFLSEKSDGDMTFSEERETNKNRRTLLSSLKIKPEQVVGAGLVHKDNVKVVGEKDKGKLISEIDGLLTSRKDLYLALTVADCLPVFLFEPKKEIVGLVHCGCRGLSQDILCKTCGKIKENWGKDLDNLLVFIGPGICGDCYKIHKERAEKFLNYSRALKKEGDEIYLDLKRVAQQQLLSSDVKRKNIKISSKCTAENSQKYFSYWRQGDPLQTMLALIGLRGGENKV